MRSGECKMQNVKVKRQIGSQRRAGTRAPLHFALAVAALLGWAAGFARAAEYFVVPTGNDTHAGSKSAPFATLQHGVDALQPGDTLWVGGGVYRETVVFPRSGTAAKPIAVRAMAGQTVVLNGCEPIRGWKPWRDKIWQAPMAWTLGPGRNQVFAGDAVMIEARFPNRPAPGLEMYVAGLSPLWPTFGRFSIPQDTRKSQPGRITSKLLEGQPDDYWKGGLYYGVHYEGWCAQTGVIASSKAGEIMVDDRTRGWWFGSAYDGKYPAESEDGRGMIVGHLHALDQPGEWHWQDDTLYFIPPDGTDPNRLAVEAKRRSLALDLSGRSHVVIAGLRVQAASARLDGSTHCTLEDCHFAYLTHYLRQYNLGQIEPAGNTLRSGETGIFVGGRDNALLHCSIRFSAGGGAHLRGYHHTIHNCLIDEVSYTSHYLNAITDAVSDYGEYEGQLIGGHAITYNTLRNAGRHFFNFCGNGTSRVSRDRGPMDYAATLFAHNHLYNGMLQTRDAGFLSGYFSSGGTLNNQRAEVAYNVMHDCYDTAGMRWNALGIVYLDEGTCDVELHHNLLWAAPGSHQRSMWFNTCCVNLREHDNVFHSEFLRDSRQLWPADFPAGHPFRFGHDFDSRPPQPKWPQVIEQAVELQKVPTDLKDGDVIPLPGADPRGGWQSAVLRMACDVKEANSDRAARAAPRHRKATDPLVLEADRSDGRAEGMRSRWTFVYQLKDQAWLQFKQVPLGAGYQRFRVVYGNDDATQWRCELHLDSADGPLVGQVPLPQSDKPRGNNVQIFAEAVGELSPAATGTHDVVVVFRGPEDARPAVHFEYLRLEQARRDLPLQRNEVRLELRSGTKDGLKLGEFYPRFTGGGDNFREFVARLEPAADLGPWVLVVRSAVARPLGVIGGLTFVRGAAQLDRQGLGEPPRRDAAGHDVFPEPTHRPATRPNDAFAAARAEKKPRPLSLAVTLQGFGPLEGRLPPWTEQARKLLLAEGVDGLVSPLAPSEAWIGYTNDTLFIAARHPAQSGSELKSSRHLWAQDEGMEVTLHAPGAVPGAVVNLRGFPDGHCAPGECEDMSAATAARLAAAVEYRAKLAADGWTCQWRIPFSACGFTPQSAAHVALNLAVHRAGDTWLVWSGGGSARQLSTAGKLFFPREFAAQAALPKKDLAVWLDASDIKSIVPNSDSRLALWKDRSGCGNDARQDKPEHSPWHVQRGINGQPAVEFDERGRTRLELPDLSQNKVSATVFVVFSNPTPGDPKNHNARLFTASDGKGYDYQVGLSANVPGATTGGPRILVAAFENRWAKQVRVGCFSPRDQTFFTGRIGEILVYLRPLPRAEQDLIRAYLMCKWDL